MKRIPGYPNYLITKIGEVWSLKKKIFLKPAINRCGYLFVGLYKNKQRKGYHIHSLVLKTFVGPCPNGMECRHLDGNSTNNHLNNLCWGTKKENQNDSKRHGTMNRAKGENHGHVKLTKFEVLRIRLLYQTGRYYQRELAKMFSVHRSTIGFIVRKEHWRHI